MIDRAMRIAHRGSTSAVVADRMPTIYLGHGAPPLIDDTVRGLGTCLIPRLASINL